MKKNILIILTLIIMFLTGIIIGRVTTPIKETIVEKEVEKIVEVESPTKGLAKQYLLKFIDVQTEVNQLPTHEEQYQTTIGMRNLASQEYTLWDNLLNEIYSQLQTTLSAEDMDKLTAIQIKWIEDRDITAEAAGKKVEGGTMQPLMVTTSKSSTTKKRCLELINDYMN